MSARSRGATLRRGVSPMPIGLLPAEIGDRQLILIWSRLLSLGLLSFASERFCDNAPLRFTRPGRHLDLSHSDRLLRLRVSGLLAFLFCSCHSSTPPNEVEPLSFTISFNYKIDNA